MTWSQRTIHNPGDIVRLKSGGMKMTVVSANDFTAVCTWHNANREDETKEYPHESLVRVKGFDELGRDLA